MNVADTRRRTADAASARLSPLASAWTQAASRLREHFKAVGEGAASTGALFDIVASLRSEPRLAWVCETFDLDDLDAACLAVCLAIEVDPNLHQRLPSRGDVATPHVVDLPRLMPLLCRDLDERLALRARFAWDAPLFRHRLLVPIPTGARLPDPLRTGPLAVDPQIARTLCYGEWLDPRLARFCQLLAEVPREPAAAIALGRLADLVGTAHASREPMLLCFQGRDGSGRRTTARHLAARAGARLLVADLGLAHHLGEFAELTAPLMREAWLQDAFLYLEGLAPLMDAPSPELDRFLDDLSQDGGICIIASQQPLAFGGRRPLAPLAVDFDAAGALDTWRNALAGGIDIGEAELELLSSRYRLPPARIRTAATHAARMAQLQRGADAVPELDDLVRAARLQGPGGLAKLARKIDPIHRWEHLVLPADALRQMREICDRVEHANRVFGHWGFGPRMSLGKGTSALFVGASGTGKTMAAEVIATALALDLYKIDLSTVVSKYIGETEKNLDRVFDAARHANAVLLFDEADALFGKRSEVRDAHDRYANLEVAYLLQKMEEYEGLSVLSTNLKQNLDDAFLRRLTYTVLFPFPSSADREAIWRATCPPGLPLADDVDFARLATSFRLSGGNIRNALLAAAFFAAADGSPVGMRHLIHGVRRELQKAGKTLGELDEATLEPMPAREIAT